MENFEKVDNFVKMDSFGKTDHIGKMDNSGKNGQMLTNVLRQVQIRFIKVRRKTKASKKFCNLYMVTGNWSKWSFLP